MLTKLCQVVEENNMAEDGFFEFFHHEIVDTFYNYADKDAKVSSVIITKLNLFFYL